MRMFSPIGVFDEREEEQVHRTALRILDEVGATIESEAMLERLAGFGGRVDRDAVRVSFAQDFIEDFLADSEPFDWRSVQPHVAGYAGTYHGHYLSPETDAFEPWTLPTFLGYLKLAHHLDHTHGGVGLAFRLPGIPDEALVLFFHYLAFKLGGRSAQSLNHVRWCPHILAMCEAVAADKGSSVRDVFGAFVEMISPLKLGREEARIFTFFAERGLRIGIGHMLSAGGTAPVTLAGAIALNLAQDILVSIIGRAWFGDRSLSLTCSISPLDMRTAMYPYGRPEKEMCNVAMAQMARRYGARFGGHCGHTDAKRPSPEVGFQRALNAIPTLMACGRTTISCGLLSVDEIFSPVQMVIDDEMVSCLGRFARGFEVSEETLAFDLIRQVGPGGQFLATEHTARHFRSELWEPRVFSREMLAPWLRHGAGTDVDRAREIVHSLVRRDPMPVHISESLERTLLAIIRETTGARIAPVEPA